MVCVLKKISSLTLCSSRDTARRGTPHPHPISRITRTTSPFLIISAAVAYMLQVTRNGHTTPATQITTIHVFAQAKAGD